MFNKDSNNIFDKLIVMFLVSIIFFIFVVSIGLIIMFPLCIEDQKATIKVKEKLSEDGIVITETQINKLIEEKI